MQTTNQYFVRCFKTFLQTPNVHRSSVRELCQLHYSTKKKQKMNSSIAFRYRWISKEKWCSNNNSTWQVSQKKEGTIPREYFFIEVNYLVSARVRFRLIVLCRLRSDAIRCSLLVNLWTTVKYATTSEKQQRLLLTSWYTCHGLPGVPIFILRSPRCVWFFKQFITHRQTASWISDYATQ